MNLGMGHIGYCFETWAMPVSGSSKDSEPLQVTACPETLLIAMQLKAREPAGLQYIFHCILLRGWLLVEFDFKLCLSSCPKGCHTMSILPLLQSSLMRLFNLWLKVSNLDHHFPFPLGQKTHSPLCFYNSGILTMPWDYKNFVYC